MNKKKVVFYTSHFYPETFRGNDIAIEMQSKGYDVTVVTNIPNYPLGKYFDGYSIFKRRIEIYNGIKIIRLPIIPRGNGTKLKMLLNYISELIVMSIFSLFHSLFHKYDLIFIQQLSPATIAIPAIITKKIQGIPLVYWLLDLWPESLVAGGIKNKLIINILNKAMTYIYKHCDKILISSIGFRKAIINNSHISDNLIEYFPNWCDDVLKNNMNKNFDIPILPDGFKIMFAGNIGEAQNFDNILEVALKLKDKGYSNIKWIILGDGRKAQLIRDFILENKLNDTVYLLGRYPLEYMATFFNKADCMLVSLKDELAFNLVLPAKIQAYMSCSKPIIGMINGETAQIIEKSKCGLYCDANDIESMFDLITQMSKYKIEKLNTLGNNGYQYYLNHFEKNMCMYKLNKILAQFI